MVTFPSIPAEVQGTHLCASSIRHEKCKGDLVKACSFYESLNNQFVHGTLHCLCTSASPNSLILQEAAVQIHYKNSLTFRNQNSKLQAFWCLPITELDWWADSNLNCITPPTSVRYSRLNQSPLEENHSHCFFHLSFPAGTSSSHCNTFCFSFGFLSSFLLPSLAVPPSFSRWQESLPKLSCRPGLQDMHDVPLQGLEGRQATATRMCPPPPLKLGPHLTASPPPPLSHILPQSFWQKVTYVIHECCWNSPILQA